MGFGHALTEARDVAGAKRFGAVEHASVFRDDVKSALVDDVGEQMAVLFQLIEADVSQSANPWQNSGQAANGFFAFLAATIVFAGSEFVLDHGVADHEFDGFWN